MEPLSQSAGALSILVTGGAGFIGSHTADALLARGHAVDVADDLSSGSREHLPTRARFHQVDIRSEQIEPLWRRYRYDTLVHCAAQMDVRRSVDDPLHDAGVNIQGLLNLLEAGRKNGLKTVVFASTGGAIYGEPHYIPQDEEHPTRPLSPYGIGKLAGEHYVRFYAENYGIRGVSLRYANVYGPRQNPHGEAGVVAIFSERLLQGRPCTIYGSGRQTRDYVYVDDVVQANVIAVETLLSGVYNVGTGKQTTVIDLFEEMRRLSGSEAERRPEPPRPGEQQRSVISPGKLRQHSGWQPATLLETGLQATLQWYRRHYTGSS